MSNYNVYITKSLSGIFICYLFCLVIFQIILLICRGLIKRLQEIPSVTECNIEHMESVYNDWWCPQCFVSNKSSVWNRAVSCLTNHLCDTELFRVKQIICQTQNSVHWRWFVPLNYYCWMLPTAWVKYLINWMRVVNVMLPHALYLTVWTPYPFTNIHSLMPCLNK